MDFLHYLGATVCHQIPARTFSCAGKLMPLCARCTGVYLGILSVLIMLWWRRALRTARIPGPGTITLALLAMSAAVLDMVLVYFDVYPTQGWLRLLTGYWAGAGMVVIFYPLFNSQLWPATARTPPPFSLWNTIMVLALGLPTMLATLLLVHTVAGLVALSWLTTLSMVATMLYVLFIIGYSLHLMADAAAPRWPALLLAAVAFVGLVLLMHHLKAMVG